MPQDKGVVGTNSESVTAKKNRPPTRVGSQEAGPGPGAFFFQGTCVVSYDLQLNYLILWVRVKGQGFV